MWDGFLFIPENEEEPAVLGAQRPPATATNEKRAQRSWLPGSVLDEGGKKWLKDAKA